MYKLNNWIPKIINTFFFYILIFYNWSYLIFYFHFLRAFFWLICLLIDYTLTLYAKAHEYEQTEDNHVLSPETILEESIKCHHNEISNFIIDNLINEEDLQNNIENNYHDNIYRYAVEPCNYCFFPSKYVRKCSYEA